MRQLFYSILFALFALVCFCGCGDNGGEQKPLKVVMDATFPPYEYKSEGQIVGIDPTIMREIGQLLGRDVVFEDMNFNSIIAAIATGKADVAASGITVTEERKKQILFSDPYIEAGLVCLYLRSKTEPSIGALKYNRIGVQHGSTSDVYVTKNLAEPDRFDNAALAVEALKVKKVDYVVMDRAPAEIYCQKNPTIVMHKQALTSESYALALSKSNPELAIQINAALKTLRDTGKLAAIIAQYKDNKAVAIDSLKTLSWWGKFKEALHSNFVKEGRWKYIVSGLGVTLIVSGFSVLLGIVVGFVIATIRATNELEGRYKWLNRLCKLYLTVIRGTPVVVQLLIIYFVIFGSVDINKIVVAIVAFGLNSGAYVAEIIRGGILSIDRGQFEAGRSLGLSYAKTMRLIILPQTIKQVLPSLGNEFIVLIKETSVAGFIALQDLTKAGDIIRSQTYAAFLPLMTVAMIYLSLVIVVSHVLTQFERKLKAND